MDKLKPVSAYPSGKDKDFKITPKEAEQLKSAFDKPEFREMFNAYMEEMNDPKNREETAQYFKQLEEEGELQNQVYVDPKIGYCFTAKDSTGLRIHVNITHSEDMAEMTEVHGRDTSGNQAHGTSYQVPHGPTQPKDWKDDGEKCKVIDVAVNSRVYERATSNNKFLAFINNIASEALKKNFGITLTDVAGAKVKRNHYKGGSQPEAIMIPKKSASASGRKRPVVNAENADPNSSGDILNPNKPADETVDLKGLGEELYKSHMGGDAPMTKSEFAEKFVKDKLKEKHNLAENKPLPDYDITGMKKGFLKSGVEVPSHKVVESGSFELHEHMKMQPDAVSVRPKNLIVKVDLPKIDSARDLDVDVVDSVFKLEVPKKYKLSVQLKYPVKGDDAKAKFDKTKKLLTVTIPVEEQGSVMLMPSDGAAGSAANEEEEEEEAPLPQTSSLVQEITPEERQAMEEKKQKEQEAAEMRRREESLAAMERELDQSAEFATRRTSEQELKRQQARAEKDARRRAVMEQKEKEEEEKRLAEEAAARAEREAVEAVERAKREEEERVAREQEEAARQAREAEELEAERKRQEFKMKWEESERELDAVKDEYVEKLKREKEEAAAKEAEKRRLAQEESERKAKKELEDKTREAEEKTREALESAKDAKKMSDKEREREEERRQDQIRDEMFTAAPKPLIPNHPRTGTDFEIAMQYVPLAYYTASNLYGDVQFRFTDCPADSFTLRIGSNRDEPEIITGLTTIPPTFVLSFSKENFTRLVSGKTDMGSLIYDKSCLVNDIAKVKVFENAFDFLEASYHSFVTGGIDFGMNKFRKLHDDENTKKEIMVLENDILLELA